MRVASRSIGFLFDLWSNYIGFVIVWFYGVLWIVRIRIMFHLHLCFVKRSRSQWPENLATNDWVCWVAGFDCSLRETERLGVLIGDFSCFGCYDSLLLNLELNIL